MKDSLNTLRIASSTFQSSAFSEVKRFMEFCLQWSTSQCCRDIVLFCGSIVVDSTSTQKPMAELVIETAPLTSHILSFCMLSQFHLMLEGGKSFPKSLGKVLVGRKRPNLYCSLRFDFPDSPVELSVTVYLCIQALGA